MDLLTAMPLESAVGPEDCGALRGKLAAGLELLRPNPRSVDRYLSHYNTIAVGLKRGGELTCLVPTVIAPQM